MRPGRRWVRLVDSSIGLTWNRNLVFCRFQVLVVVEVEQMVQMEQMIRERHPRAYNGKNSSRRFQQQTRSSTLQPNLKEDPPNIPGLQLKTTFLNSSMTIKRATWTSPRSYKKTTRHYWSGNGKPLTKEMTQL